MSYPSPLPGACNLEVAVQRSLCRRPVHHPATAARHLLPAFLATVFLFLPARRCAAQSDGAPIALGSYRVLHSRILGEDRVLQLHLPRGYQSGEQAYPVVYLFYSDSEQGYFAQVVNDLYHLSMNRTPPMILVGIPNTQRYRDLLPWSRPGGMGEEGRADVFLRFVREELLPFVEREYRTKPYRVLVGPQAAAVFGVYTLLEAPGTFQAFALNDPCVVDGPERSLCREVAAFAATPQARGTYLAVSDVRGGPPRDSRHLEALRAGLEAGVGQGFRWRIVVEEGWPFFLPPVRLREALLEVFSDYPFPSPAEARSLEAVEAHYHSVSASVGVPLEPPDLVLTLAANGMMGRGEHPEALRTFQRLVELHPSSLNGPWGLANLHRAMGDTATAIRFYQECLRRDPNLGPAREWIRRLGGGGGRD